MLFLNSFRMAFNNLVHLGFQVLLCLVLVLTILVGKHAFQGQKLHGDTTACSACVPGKPLTGSRHCSHVFRASRLSSGSRRVGEEGPLMSDRGSLGSQSCRVSLALPFILLSAQAVPTPSGSLGAPVCKMGVFKSSSDPTAPPLSAALRDTRQV